MLHMVLLYTVTMYDFHDSTDTFLVNPSFLQFCVPNMCTLNYIRSKKKPGKIQNLFARLSQKISVKL